MKPDITLGDLCKDKVTSFNGVVTAVTVHRNGMARAQIQPRDLVKGTIVKPLEFDFEELDILEKRVVAPTPLSYDGPIKLGDRVIAKGQFEGIVDQIRTSLAGCVQFAIDPQEKYKDGLWQDTLKAAQFFHSFDVEMKKPEAAKVVPPSSGTGAVRMAKPAR